METSGQPRLTYKEFTGQFAHLTGLLHDEKVVDPTIVEAAASSADLLLRAHPDHAKAYDKELEQTCIDLAARMATIAYWREAPGSVWPQDTFSHPQQTF